MQSGSPSTVKAAEEACKALIRMLEQAGEVYGGDKFFVTETDD